MVTIKIMDHVNRCFSNVDGDIIYNKIKTLMDQGEMVALSFEGIPAINSSFINSALVELLESYTLESIKGRLTFVHTTRQINEMIRNRLTFESSNPNFV